MNSPHFAPRAGARRGLPLLAFALAAATLWPRAAEGQQVLGGDFDICADMGTLRGKTAFLVGRAGFGSNRGVFVLVNAANSDQDCSRDGFTPGVDFFDLFVRDTTDFLNIDNPDIVISRDNFVLAAFLNPLRNGFANEVAFFVNIPAGTPAGRYRGAITIEDSVLLVGSNPNGAALRRDEFRVEIEVLANRDIDLVQSDTAAPLDSLVLTGRSGQTVSGVARIANLGNVDLSNVRLEATDLVATSGTGLRIRRERISFSPTQLETLERADTARVVVTVRIPIGLLAGSYRGDLILQGDGVSERRIPLIVIVTSPGDIVFENNPVSGRAGDNAVIIFNADAGSQWQMRIFDMRAITTFAAEGTVFAGGGSGGPGAETIPGDEAVRFTWPLVNGRGEAVAGGMYYVVISAEQNGVRRQLRGRLMVIR